MSNVSRWVEPVAHGAERLTLGRLRFHCCCAAVLRPPSILREAIDLALVLGVPLLGSLDTHSLRTSRICAAIGSIGLLVVGPRGANCAAALSRSVATMRHLFCPHCRLRRGLRPGYGRGGVGCPDARPKNPERSAAETERVWSADLPERGAGG